MATEQYKIVLSIDGKDNASLTIDKTNKSLKDMDSEVKKTTSSWGSFKTGVSTALGAFAIAGGVAAVVGQINDLGRAANAAEITFNQVTGGADEANASLARMRALTGGVIDDMSLMKGASSLLVTGIAQTNEQAEELVNLGARLGTVMGVDAAESIANLNSALLNNSFMRLDTLGISAARVRERVNELKEAGMDMSEAFSQAVLEIGSKTLNDLGGAAAVAETAIGRLATKFNNMGQDLSQFVNMQLETAATTLEQLVILWDIAAGGTGGVPALEAQAAAAEQAAAEYQQLIDLARQLEATSESLYQTTTGQAVTEVIEVETAANFAAANPEQFASMSSGSYFADLAASGDYEQLRSDLESVFGMDMSMASIESLNNAVYDLDATFGAVATAQETLELQTTQTNAALEEQQRAMADASSADAFLYSSTQISTNMLEIEAGAKRLGETFSDGLFFSSGGVAFFDPDELTAVQNETAQIVDEYERLKMLGESSEFTMVSEEEVERAREIAESATATAESAERNARAWENASLAMIAGATGGGRQNEFNQGVLANIEDPELRAEAEAQLNLGSGVETANTRVIDYFEALNAAIFEEFGTAAGSRAATTINTALEEGMAAGLSGEALQNYVEEQVGYALGTSAEGGTSVGGTEVQIQAGEGYQAVAARTGFTVEELEAATGGRMLMAGEVITVGDNQLIALNENTPVETVSGAANTVMGGFGDSNIQAVSQDSLAPMQAQSTSDYTYFNPSTGTYDYANDPASQPITPETAESTSIVADDMLSIETSVTNIAATDTSTAFDPMITDVDEATVKIDEFQGKLTAITEMDLSLELPISFVFDAVSADIMSRNSSVIELFRLVLPMVGVPTS
jgi:hypothetical protein